jgi:hypothetical protein
LTSGSPQSGYSVTVGGTAAAYIHKWGNATAQTGHPADLYTYHKMQFVQFVVSSSTSTGAQNLVVTTPNGSSNSLTLTIRATGTFRFVKPTGTDSGAGTWVSPWQTLQYALGFGGSAIQPGDIVYGYNTSSAGDVYTGQTGTSEATYVALVSYPGTSTTINGSLTNNSNRSNNYWAFSRLRLVTNDNGISPHGYMIATGNEITDNTCANGSAGAFYGEWDTGPETPIQSAGIKLYGNYIHDYGGACTTNQQHVMYIAKRNAPYTWPSWDIGWNHLSDNAARSAIHFYDEHQCGAWSGTHLVHDNVIKNQEGVALDVNAGPCDAGWTYTVNVNFYNNLIINAGRGDYGQNAPTIQFLNLPTYGPGPEGTARVYNNTIYGFGRAGGGTGYDAALGAMALQSSSSKYYWHFVNNIVVDTLNNPWTDTSSWTDPSTHTNNLWYYTGGSKAAPTWDTSPSTANPGFTNAAGGDFTLTANIAGANLSGYFSKDFLGNTRSNWTLGAFEYGASGGVATPGATTGTVFTSGTIK